MFSGIVEETGSVVRYDQGRLTIASKVVADSLDVADSVSVNGTCLTIVESSKGRRTIELQPETVRRTWLGQLKNGDPVNLEGPLAADGRISGHFVQGHIDGVGTIESIVPDGEAHLIWIAAPSDLLRYVVQKGFIAVDGISLTVADVDDNVFSVAIVRYTWENTNLRTKSAGDAVNIEVDVLAKYVEKLLLARSVMDASEEQDA